MQKMPETKSKEIPKFRNCCSARSFALAGGTALAELGTSAGGGKGPNDTQRSKHPAAE